MKRKLTIFAMIFIVLLTFLIIAYTFYINRDFKNIVINLKDSPYIELLESELKVNIFNTNKTIIIDISGTFNNEKVNKKYRLKYKNKRFKFIAEENVDYIIYKALLSAIFKSYGYDYEQINVISEKDEYSLNKAGIKVKELDNKKEYAINVSSNNKIIEDVDYISKDYLGYKSFDKEIKTKGYFLLKRGNIFMFKLFDSKNNENVIYIAEYTKGDNTYKTIKEIIPLILDTTSANSFNHEYTTLKNIDYDNIKIILDYNPPKDEVIIDEVTEDTRITKIIYPFKSF